RPRRPGPGDPRLQPLGRLSAHGQGLVRVLPGGTPGGAGPARLVPGPPGTVPPEHAETLADAVPPPPGPRPVPHAAADACRALPRSVHFGGRRAGHACAGAAHTDPEPRAAHRAAAHRSADGRRQELAGFLPLPTLNTGR